jgi:hypothetical protein
VLLAHGFEVEAIALMSFLGLIECFRLIFWPDGQKTLHADGLPGMLRARYK